MNRIIKNLQVAVSLALLLVASQAFTSSNENVASEIIGVYWSPRKDAKIEIYTRGQQYFGKFIWLAAPRKDTKNPVHALQSRNVLGLELLTGFTYNNGTYQGGEIYDPETGKTYSCKMTLEGNKLKVRGYIGISLFGRTEYFERIK